jgi:predicted transcriptional regulator
MAETKRKPGRPRVPSKQGIYSRIDKGIVVKLDSIAAGMVPPPTRAALIEVAVAQFVERNYKGKK